MSGAPACYSLCGRNILRALSLDILCHCPPRYSMVFSATSKDFEPMQSPEFMACCFCNKPTRAVGSSLVQGRFAHPECYVKHVKARSREVEIPAAKPRYQPAMKFRAIVWTVTMAYTGFLLTGQGLRTFNSLSISEGFLGALTGFLLAVMFTLREKRRQRSGLIAYSFAEILPNWGIPPEDRRS
jgi:hypothetical protein